MKGKTALLLSAAFLLFFVSLYLGQQRGELAGTDEMAERLVREIAPDFRPWFFPLWEPPSGEIETMIFSLQAAIGGLIIGYVLGKRST
ncbi:energy-coupling factor ABC transporter substrate-binding protein [Candidatus Caldatribacterium sp.]|uniref:energy-coupling factor ABC transporter substrate-binding protein n=1 Tax=Candidatus Caldatribacterium sp. TaxID=2282143 RepID=UPI0029953CCB|nr:energy-coupling factor ABC transporter substrate-binding protein [Candidatus Caldatribacterium sp.]MDW8081843.1 energy-coupling factor ABC transporter substrate-binding protein [Candidatus Calescibacterium sp.]